MKKMLVVLLSVLMALLMTCAWAEEAEPTVYTSGDWEYVLLEDGTAEIAGYTGTQKDLTIPEQLAGYTVTAIGEQAFSDDALTSVVIPDSVTKLGWLPFSAPFKDPGNPFRYWDSALTSIHLGAGVTDLFWSSNTSNGFDRLIYPLLECITVSPENPQYCVENGLLIDKSSATLICCPAAMTGRVVVPDWVTAFEPYALAAPGVSCIRLPEGLPCSVHINGTFFREEDLAFPDALTAERMDAILTNLPTKKDQRTLTDAYKEIDPAKYGKKDDPEQLEAAYPALADGTVVWILRSAKENMKTNTAKKLADAFTAAGYTADDLATDYRLVYKRNALWSGNEIVWEVFVQSGFPAGCELENLPGLGSIIWALQKDYVPAELVRSGDYFYIPGENSTASIAAYTGRESTVIIPEEIDGHAVTGIGGEAFFLTENVTAITLPDSVTDVAETAFLYAMGLTEIYVSPEHPTLAVIDGVLFEKASRTLLCYPEGRTEEVYEIPNGIRRIAPYAFSDIGILRWPAISSGDMNEDGLRELIIPDSVTEIAPRAFYANSSLTRVTIGTGVTSIGDYAFYNCDALTEITIPGNVVSIGDSAFYDCAALRTVVLEDGVTSIGGGAFAGCSSLETASIPASVTEMGTGVFGSCSMLTSVTIAHGVTAIPQNAFGYCKALTSIDIPASVTDIGDGAFQQCHALETATISGCEARIGDKAFENCSALKSVTISEGVRHIGSEAFRNCRALERVTFPETMTTIGEFAFHGCESLISVTIPSSVTEIGKAAFCGCHALRSATLSPGLAEIPESMFSDCYLLREVEIPEGVISIASGVFWNCASLTELSLPASLESIAEGAFDDCPLAEVTVPRDSYAAQWCKENNLRYTYPDSLDWLLD